LFDAISFKVSAKKGLKLSGLTVTTDTGEKVNFDDIVLVLIYLQCHLIM